MKFKEIRLKNFGQFQDKTIKLEDGIHLIYGENETGKSTIHSFIRGMLFGIEKQRGRVTKMDMYTKYQPWNSTADYTGTMDVDIDGKTYRIYRNFNKENRTYSVVELVTGREIPVSDIKGVSFIENLTEDNYRNTISIEQCKARTDKELAVEVSNYITNLSTSGNHQVNIGKAIEFLTAKRKAVNISKTEEKISELEELIEEDTQDESYMQHLYQRKEQIGERIEAAQKLIQNEATDKLEQYIAEFKTVKDTYAQYIEAESIPPVQEEISEKRSFKHGYLILPAVILAVGAVILFLNGWKKEYMIYAGIGTILSLIFSYILMKRNKSRSVTEENRVQEIEEAKMHKTEHRTKAEQYIIQYGSRICDFDQVNESSMTLLAKEVNELENQLSRKKMKLMKSQEETKLEYERINWELETYEQKENYFYEHKNEYEELIEHRKRQEAEIKAIDTAKNTIQEIGVEIHDGFGHNLNKVISEFVSRQTNGRYGEIKIDEKLNMKVLSDGKFIELDKLSIGTIEQIYLALRLAAAQLLYGEESMPLLFDDAFAFYDDKRLRATLEMLGKESDRQILIFTCQKREEEILKSLNLPYHKQSLG